ncbi:FAD-dependent oxidoreductase [Streptomyces crystallinus]|uniref:FAD-dependent oxidoreductase n=2 Tax=Streptomyces crystallinus TaxID=68191 RepID=A0ABP3RLW7_9ACTN
MGHLQLERWFPGFTEEILAAGALLGQGAQVEFHVDGVRKVDLPEARMLSATRPFLEGHLRRRVMALPNVRFLRGRASGLLDDGRRVTGVRLTTVAPALEQTHTGDLVLDADLVVDAMGRSSRLGRWLQDNGWAAPPLDRMRVDLGYATASFTRGDELPSTVIAHATPGPAHGYQPRLSEPGALAAVEDNRWSVVLAGYTDYRPGSDPEQFLARMRRCVAPLRTVADTCAMAGEVRTYHFRESVRRDFTGLTRFPGGLLAVGDSVASVNPIYGQGLTLAALQASSLAVHLTSGAHPHAPAWGYFRRARTVVGAAWDMATTADLAQPHVTGPYPRGYRLTRWAGDQLITASIHDAQVNRAFMDVLHLKAHPRTLTRPSLLLRAALTRPAR